MQANIHQSIRQIDAKERIFALSIGLIFLLLGIAGFIPAFMTLPSSAPYTPVDAPRLAFDAGYGYVFGLFPTNFFHNAVHLAVGLLGIAASTSLSGAVVFNQGFAISYAAIALMGLLPATNTTFGLMPIYGNNVWFNALAAIAASYVGFVKPTEILKSTGVSSNS
jgi:hypothetical protein